MTLAEYRQKKGYTQEQVALAIGVSWSAYNYYENGKRRIPTDVVDSIAKFLRMSKKDKANIFLPSNFTVCEISETEE